MNEDWVKAIQEVIQLLDKAITQLKRVQIEIARQIVREEQARKGTTA